MTDKCRCCLVLEADKDMTAENMILGSIEIFSDMLKECFEIQLKMDLPNSRGICNTCIAQLRAAYMFKKQVLECQKQFESLTVNYMDIEVKNVDIKIEQDDSDDFLDDSYNTEFKEENDSDILDEDDKSLMLIAQEQKKTKGVKRKIGKDKNEDSTQSKKTKRTKKTSNITKYRHNIHVLLQCSNATPFTNKSVHGFVCAYCKKGYRKMDELRDHVDTIHRKDDLSYVRNRDPNNLCLKLDIKDLKCNLCNHTFDWIEQLKTHLVTEHKKKIYQGVKDYILEFKFSESEILKCAKCESQYETFKMLLQHMNGHYRNFECNLCDLGFVNIQRLKNHLRIHELGSFKCSYCEKVFSTRTKHASHEKYTHKNGARYITECPNCDKSFTSYYQRNRHMQIEHNIAAASYKCNICDKNFLMKCKLTYHIKKVHLMERNHICPECGLGFFMKQYLTDHMIKHGGERIHKCDLCLKSYARKKTLREHMRIHANDRRFKCGVCNMAFVQKCSLKSHLLSNHGMTLVEYENCEKLKMEGS